jgi:uncharacterized damage-inducible protein DinB
MKLWAILFVFAMPLLAQNPYSDDARASWMMIKTNVLKTAQMVPEEKYSFKPADSVRTIGQLVGHIADAQNAICGAASGKKADVKGSAEKLATKAELVAALEASQAFCDAACTAATDAAGSESVKLFGMSRTRLGWLHFNVGHSWEHYGNLSTYVRINGMVPPSSERRN